MEHSPRGRKRARSKVCIRQVTLSAGNPITAGFIGCRVPSISSLSCIEISHFSKRCAGRCDKNQISRRIEAVVTRLTRNQFDSNVTWVRIPPSAPRAAPCGVLLFYFYSKLCKGCKVGFEQPVPGALRPSGQKCPGGAFLGRGRIPPSAPSITTQFHIG